MEIAIVSFIGLLLLSLIVFKIWYNIKTKWYCQGSIESFIVYLFGVNNYDNNCSIDGNR